jgi:chemotaxis protein methyltransferase CheR
MPHLHMGLLARRDADADAARRELSLAFTLLATEEPSRVLLFGGGFSRDALLDLCRAELRAAGGEP